MWSCSVWGVGIFELWLYFNRSFLNVLALAEQRMQTAASAARCLATYTTKIVCQDDSLAAVVSWHDGEDERGRQVVVFAFAAEGTRRSV